jgi:cell division protein FtsL
LLLGVASFIERPVGKGFSAFQLNVLIRGGGLMVGVAAGRRLRGGLVWISLFAVLLVGVVAINVAVLRANMALNNLNQKQLQLESQNQTLASQVSSAGSSLRIEQAAHRLRLVPAQAADTSYLDLAHR